MMWNEKTNSAKSRFNQMMEKLEVLEGQMYSKKRQDKMNEKFGETGTTWWLGSTMTEEQFRIEALAVIELANEARLEWIEAMKDWVRAIEKASRINDADEIIEARIENARRRAARTHADRLPDWF